MTAGSIVAPQIIPIRVPLPGKVKNHIDTATPVEIKSDTPGVTIYYTLDGSKPESLKRTALGESIQEYTRPIRLPYGKVTVRAFATTSDGRESAVVTKFFLVDRVPSPEPDEDLFLTEHAQILPKQDAVDGPPSLARWTRGITNAWEEPPRKLPVKIQGAVNIQPSLSLQKSLSASFTKPMSSGQVPSQVGVLPYKSLTKTHISRIQRETDFLRCVKCLNSRPSDPFTRFCLHCGTLLPAVPGQRLPPTEGAQMGLCVSCKTMVPLNTPSCVVCEAPIPPQLQPQASLRLKDKVICLSCGAGNPPHITSCVTCEATLPQPPTPKLIGHSAPPLPSTNTKMLTCSKCKRLNASDARYCDWCGSKHSPLTSCLICSCCGANIHPYATFCGCCGVFLEGPRRPGLDPDFIPLETAAVDHGSDKVICLSCGTGNPAHITSCVTCEAMLPQPPDDRVKCLSCGTGNPAHLTSCVTCEAKLPQPETDKVKCLFCGTANFAHITSCVTCATRLPQSPNDEVLCLSCGAGNPPHVTSCITCEAELPQPGTEKICLSCGTGHPAHLTSCVFCEASLPLARTEKIVCPSCGTGNPDHLTSCITCQATLPQPEAVADNICSSCGTGIPAHLTSCIACEAILQPEPDNICSSCGTGIPAHQTTCTTCEAILQQESEKVICPSCGTGNSAHLTSCIICQTKLLQPETVTGADIICPSCGTGNPDHLTSCLACEAILQPETDMVICPSCGAGNPVSLTSCITCEARLPQPETDMILCLFCGTGNPPHFTSCVTCEAKLPQPGTDKVICLSCGTGNPAHLTSCVICEASLLEPETAVEELFEPDVTVSPPRVDQHTQTVGLYYPSCTDLQKKEDQLAQEEARLRLEQIRIHTPLRTVISPGRGFWRLQLNHICAHLRSYTQNNIEYRTLIGEPRMGRIISATLEEDDHEVIITITFKSVTRKKSKYQGVSGKPLYSPDEALLLNSMIGSLSASQTSLESENDNLSSSAAKKKKNRKKNKTLQNGEALLDSKDKQLLWEVGPEGRGQIFVVQQLLDEGADPSCQSSDGRPALTVAVLNRHHEVIPVLVRRGANVDQQSGPLNNTALHEAAAAGAEGLECANNLLGCKASIRKKNDKGQTAYDLAVSSGCNPLVSLITAKMGQGMLEKLTRPRRNTDIH